MSVGFFFETFKLFFIVHDFPVAIEKEPGDECEKETCIYAVASYQESSEQH